jgi:iron complex transport system substrate-binding protein
MTFKPQPPQRIVCTTEETTEWLYLLGEEDRIAGISGFTVRPARARKEKPKVSAFTSAKNDKIIDLQPDLVIGFSDIQADIAAELIRLGIPVFVCNQRSVADIFDTLLQIGNLVGAGDKAQQLLTELDRGIADITDKAKTLTRRPRIYFEEWNDPMISGIRWVSELIELAGGDDCFGELAQHQGAKQRIIEDPSEVVRRNPDIIIGSWCGRKFAPDQVRGRTGWEVVNAVRYNELHEIKSADILQPGPACLTDGIRQLHDIICQWSEKQ